MLCSGHGVAYRFCLKQGVHYTCLSPPPIGHRVPVPPQTYTQLVLLVLAFRVLLVLVHKTSSSTTSTTHYKWGGGALSLGGWGHQIDAVPFNFTRHSSSVFVAPL